MNKNSRKTRIYIIFMLLTTAVATTLRTVAYAIDFDYASGFFVSGSIINAANAIIWLEVPIMITYAFATQKTVLKASFSTAATYIPTGMLGIASLFLGAKTLYYAISTSPYPLFSIDTFKFYPQAQLAIIIAILSIAAVAYCLFNTYIIYSLTQLRSYFALGTVMFFALYAVLTFLDLKSNSALSINDAGKKVNLMAFLFCSMFLLYEARISLGREMWRTYTVTGLIAASFAAYSSIPTIITYYVNGAMISSSGEASLSSIEECMAIFTLFIYILARIILSASLKEETENKLISAMENYAQMRDDRVNESFNRHQEEFAAKQLSLFELLDEDECENLPKDEVRVSEEENEELQQPMISDDVIYESIFGKMPPKEEPEESQETAREEPEEPEETSDDRNADEIADDILNTVNELMKADITAQNESDKDE